MGILVLLTPFSLLYVVLGILEFRGPIIHFHAQSSGSEVLLRYPFVFLDKSICDFFPFETFYQGV